MQMLHQCCSHNMHAGVAGPWCTGKRFLNCSAPTPPPPSLSIPAAGYRRHNPPSKVTSVLALKAFLTGPQPFGPIACLPCATTMGISLVLSRPGWLGPLSSPVESQSYTLDAAFKRAALHSSHWMYRHNHRLNPIYRHTPAQMHCPYF